MRRTLLVTNDFPPRAGGIQSYLRNLIDELPADRLVVYASDWRGSAEYDAVQPFPVYRHGTSLMLPTPAVARRARRIIAEEQIEAVWFGAAAPLAVLAPYLRSAGARRIVASTHGHEVGWSMLPGARNVLRFIGNHTDAITYVSRYTRGRFAAAFGPQAALEYVPPGVDIDRFVPDPVARLQIRDRHGIADDDRLVLCLSRLVPRKGQDTLIRAMPGLLAQQPDARLLIVGGGPYADRLHRLAAGSPAAERIGFTGSVPAEELPRYHAAADVFAMPARTRGGGLDVEGLGIVYLEASASGIPVVAGCSGGAPETVRDGETGTVVDGRRPDQVAGALAGILTEPVRAARMGAAGRDWVTEHWQWSQQAQRLSRLLD